MLSRMKSRMRSLVALARSRWVQLGRRRQVAVGGIALFLAAGAITAGAIFAFGEDGGQGPLNCEKPICVEVLGPRGANVHPMMPVRIWVAGAVDHQAAVEALNISHQPPGQKQFEGDILTFRPEWPGFARGENYQVVLALPREALPPQAEPVDVSFSFTTDGKLEVSSVFPESGAREVSLDAPIMVQFNRSVAPLTVIQERGPERIIEFDPPAAGQGRWLNTSLYTYAPKGDGWAPATRYTARVKAGLTNQLGAQLEKDYVFSFTTLSPGVASFDPPDKSRFVAPTPQVTVAFNQPVDRASAQTGFALTLEGDPEPLPGSFRWPESLTFVFQPSRPLPLSTTFVAVVRAGVQARDADVAMAEDVRWTFSTVGIPRVASTQPADGSKRVGRFGLRITFTNPMDQQSVEDHITIEPKPDDDPFFSWEENGRILFIGLSMEPSTPYRVTLSTEARDRYGQPLTEALDLKFVTDRIQPAFMLSRASSSGTYNAYLDPEIRVTSWNLERLNFQLYRIDREGLIGFAGPRPGPYKPPASGLIREWSELIEDPPLDALVITTTRLAEESKLPEGVYFLRVSSPGVKGYDEMPIVISSANVTTRWTRHDLLVWVVDMKTGNPLVNLPLDILNGSAGVVATATTDGDGVARVDLPPPPRGDYFDGYYVSAQTARRTVLSGTQWNDGIAPWDFSSDLPFQFSPQELVGHLYTDRPIYRPGETVYFKGVVRRDDDARYSLPPGVQLSFRVRDDQGRLIDTRTVTLSDMGTFDSELALSSEAPTGLYSVELTEGTPSLDVYVPPVASVSFRVAEFRKPEFEVQVTADRDFYANGDVIKATVSADLFFGAPLANAEVEWRVTADPYLFQHEDYPGYSFSDYTPRFDLSFGPFYESQQFLRGEGIGTTDSRGRFAFTVPADVSSDPLSQTFTLEATVTDENAQSVAAFSAVRVHKGQFYIGMKPDSYVAIAGNEAMVSLATIDPEGNARAGLPVEISVYQRRWRTVRERDPDGEQRYRSEPEDTLVQTITTATGTDGAGGFAFTPRKSGQYFIVAEAKDSADNAIRSSVFLWAASGEHASWRITSDNIVELVADKDEYRPGDTARILVATPFEGSRGLVTQERGRLMSYQTRDFPTNSEVLEVRITSDHIPNVYLGVTLFKPPTPNNPMPQVKFGLVELKVSTEKKDLRISIEPSGDRFQPRDSVRYDIRTTDSEGKGASAELSIALVDRAVLSLQDDFALPALEAFWSRRPLGVLTASSFAVSIDRANELTVSTPQPNGKGGGGGLGDQTRTFFPNTAYWEPALRTDSQGRATVEIRLPDTLTTWRLTAKGVTADTKVGEARSDVITSKDLIVRPVVPRFLIADDRASLGAIVHNFTDEPLDVVVSLTAQGLEVQGRLTRSVTIEPGDEALVRWDTRALPTGDGITLTFEARADSVSDSVQLRLPRHAFFTPETVATAGTVQGEASEVIQIPYYVRPDAGELTVSVSPSLASGVNTAIQYIKEYPYESAELTVSRFVSVLALRRATDELGLTDLRPIGGDAQALAQRSLQRLYNHQHADGGWGWWIGDDSDAAVTAYVLIGFAEAKRSGFEVDAGVEDDAVAYLMGQLDKRRDVIDPEFDLRAYILYSLARDERGDLGRSFALAEQRASLSNTAKAWIALAIKLSGGAEDDPRLTSLLSDLQSAAIPSATGNHWEEAEYNPDTFGNSTQTTAQVLQAFIELQPEHPLVDGTLRWLMVARKEGRWESPHDTAVALLAITDFMVARKDVQAAFDYRVDLNGEAKLEGSPEAGRVHQEDKVVIEMKDLLKDALNELKITRTPAAAAGRLYYTAHLRYFAPAENVEAANHGIGVSHQYFRANVDEETPVAEVQLGDVVKVKVTLVAESDLNFLVLEDYLPAGLEPIDASLKTTPSEFRRRLYEEQGRAYQVSKRYSPFGHTDIRDNRVALFARFVPKGVYEYTYFAQATTPGEFSLPPATAYEQYFPEVWGRSDGGTFAVKDEGTASAFGPLAGSVAAAGAGGHDVVSNGSHLGFASAGALFETSTKPEDAGALTPLLLALGALRLRLPVSRLLSTRRAQTCARHLACRSISQCLSKRFRSTLYPLGDRYSRLVIVSATALQRCVSTMTMHGVLLGSVLAATVILAAVACGGGGPGTPTPDSTATLTATPSAPAATSTPTILPTPTPELTPTAAPTPTVGTSGSPFSFGDLQEAFEARGIAVDLGDPGAGFSGFAATASDTSVVRGEDSMELSILVYEDIEVIKEDWELTVGASPMPKEGRALPDHISIWWNENFVVVVRSSVGAISSDALDAFLALGEPPASPTPSATPSE